MSPLPVPVSLLHAFIVFCGSRTILEAASRLRITQPALSKQLKALEAYLPAPVFTRIGRKKTLTPFGRELRGRLEERISGIQEVIHQSWLLHSSPHEARLRIMGRRGVLDRVSAKLRFPGSLYFLEGSNAKTISSILSMDVDLGIAHSVPDSSELVAKPLFREKFQLVIPKALLPARPRLGEALLIQLRELPALGYKPKDEILGFSGFPAELTIFRATESYASLVEMVGAGLGWAALPSYFNPDRNRNWVLPIPEQRLPARKFFLIYRAELGSVTWLKALKEEIHSCFSPAPS